MHSLTHLLCADKWWRKYLWECEEMSDSIVLKTCWWLICVDICDNNQTYYYHPNISSKFVSIVILMFLLEKLKTNKSVVDFLHNKDVGGVFHQWKKSFELWTLKSSLQWINCAWLCFFIFYLIKLNFVVSRMLKNLFWVFFLFLWE